MAAIRSPAVPLKGSRSRQHFVEDGTEGKEIAPCVGLLAAQLFRRHVRKGADDDPPRRERIGGVCRCGVVGGGWHPKPGEAEVEQLDACPSSA